MFSKNISTLVTFWVVAVSSVASTTASASTPTLVAPLSEYSHVPGGRMVHASCIHPIPSKPGVIPHIDLNDNIIENGTTVAHYDPCKYAALDSSGAPLDSTAGTSPSINGWVQYGTQSYTDSSGNGWDELYQDIVVPSAPSCYPSCPTGATNGIVDYFWNGLQPTSTGGGPGSGLPLIQPVLQWGEDYGSGTGSNSSWVMQEWYCNVNGNCYPHGQITVNVGDTIFTEMYLENQWDGTDQEWEIYVYDYNTGTPSGVYVDTPYYLHLADDAVLEAYHITNCNQMPSLVSFEYTTLYGGGPGSGTSVSFAPNVSQAYSGITPSGCGYDVSVNYEEGELYLYQ